MKAILLLNFIAPFVMVLAGLILKQNPSHDMRKENGYSTPLSRKSQAHWDYAQAIAPDIYIVLGKWAFLAELVLTVLLLILPVSIETGIEIGAAMGMAFAFSGFYFTDKKIKEKFGNQ